MYSLPGGISTPAMGASIPSSGPEMNMEQDIIAGPGGGALVTTSLGTPLKLAPSSAAFRKPGGGAQPPAHTGTGAPADSAGLNKSVFGQVSDMIFGW
jgi:nuclear pore complex protein Nup53